MFFLIPFASEDKREKFEYLYNKYKPLMLHKAHAILQDHMLAEDALSEAFMRIYRNLHKIDDPDSNRSVCFIMTIVKNTALTLLKKKQRHSAEEYEDMQDNLDVEEFVLSKLSSEHIHALLENMQEEQKSVFLLKYAYDMTHKEIGKLLGITEQNAAVRLHRARKWLVEALSKEGYLYGRA